eukprot:161706_1
MSSFSILIIPIVWTNFITVSFSAWVQSGRTMSLSTKGNAVGYLNDIVFIYEWFRFSEYDTSTNTFSQIIQDNGDYASYAFGDGQLYTQQQQLLYTLPKPENDPEVNYLMVFDMNIKQSVHQFTLPQSHDLRGCLASSNQYLIVTGGSEHVGPSHAIVQVFDRLSYQWVGYGSPMLSTRSSHSCIAHNDVLWVFGGSDPIGPTYLSSNERISVTNITQNSWRYTYNELPQSLHETRAVEWSNNIYIIGGRNDGGIVDTMYIMDTVTETFQLSPDRLVYPVSNTNLIEANGILYAFGGLVSDTDTNTFMYYTLPTATTTTKQPTENPTSIPTIYPTQNPTINPTSIPTPTPNPSVSPVSNPTSPPTKTPSFYPTMKATINPTTPSPIFTTVRPSKSPTKLSVEPPISIATTTNTRDERRDTIPSTDLDAYELRIAVYVMIAFIVCCVCMLLVAYVREQRTIEDDINQRANPVLSMINNMRKVSLSLFVTKSDIGTTGRNNKVCEEILEIEGDGAKNVNKVADMDMGNDNHVEIRYAQEGIENVRRVDKTMGLNGLTTSIEKNACITKQAPTNDAMDDV